MSEETKKEIPSPTDFAEYLVAPDYVKIYKEEEKEKETAPENMTKETTKKRPRAIPFVDGKFGDFLVISDQGKKLTVEFQEGSFLEHGYNGCYPINVIRFIKCMYEEYNKKQPSRETSMILTKLEEALLWDVMRSKKRSVTGLHGTGK